MTFMDHDDVSDQLAHGVPRTAKWVISVIWSCAEHESGDSVKEYGEDVKLRS